MYLKKGKTQDVINENTKRLIESGEKQSKAVAKAIEYAYKAAPTTKDNSMSDVVVKGKKG